MGSTWWTYSGACGWRAGLTWQAPQTTTSFGASMASARRRWDPVAIILARRLLTLRTAGATAFEEYVDVLLDVVQAQLVPVSPTAFSPHALGTRAARSLPHDGSADAAQLYALERGTSYTRPEGITGSVLVATRRHNDLFHVGTNDLQMIRASRGGTRARTPNCTVSCSIFGSSPSTSRVAFSEPSESSTVLTPAIKSSRGPFLCAAESRDCSLPSPFSWKTAPTRNLGHDVGPQAADG